ncbi:MAG: hypothetical protein Q8N98_01945 [bacterium]|nr:hypothetical protein [bacterium]
MPVQELAQTIETASGGKEAVVDSGLGGDTAADHLSATRPPVGGDYQPHPAAYRHLTRATVGIIPRGEIKTPLTTR